MVDVLKQLIQQFMPFAQEHIGFEHPPKLFLKHDTENAKNPLGKTAYYDPTEQSVTLYVTDRHPKDVLRSLGHELVHHKQNCDGKFDDIEPDDMGEGYAQTHPGLRDMEFEANSKGSMALRDFEDRLKKENTTYYEHLQKGENKMSTKEWKNKEITTLLSEAWGFKFNTLQEFDEFNGTGEVQEEADKNTGMSGVKGDDKGDTYMGHFKKDEDEIEEGKKGGKDWHATGKKAGQKGAHDKDTDYSGHGMRKGDESDTDPGDKDDTWRKGEESKTHKGLNKENLNEESGEDETWHQWKNEHADDDHIREMEHHLRALKEDRDYERHEAEYDHDKYEDEGDPSLEEGGSGRADPVRQKSDRISDDRTRPMEGKMYTQEQVHEAFRRVLETLQSKKGTTTNG